MIILDRYLSKEFLKSFLFSLFGLLFILVMLTLIENMKLQSKAPKSHLYLYILYTIPQFAVIVIPPALMFGVCFTVSQLSVSKELVAIYSAGTSFYRAVRPILIMGALLSVFVLIFQNVVATKANQLAAIEMAEMKKEVATVKDIIWQRNFRGKEGYYFIYYFDKQKLRILGGMNYLKMSPDQKPIEMLQAKKAEYSNETQAWTMHAVRKIQFTPDLTISSIEDIESLEIKFPENIGFFSRPLREPGELNLVELLEEIDERSVSGLSSIPYEVQFHANISFPFLCFIVTVIGSLAGSMGTSRSSGPLIKSILLSIATIFSYEVAFRIGQSLGNNGVVPPLVASWTPTLGFFAAAAILVWRNKK